MSKHFGKKTFKLDHSGRISKYMRLVLQILDHKAQCQGWRNLPLVAILNDISAMRFWAFQKSFFNFGWFSLFWMRIDVFCGRLCLFFFCEKVILETSESTPESLISTICSHQPLKWKTTQRNVCKMASFQSLYKILVIVLSDVWCSGVMSEVETSSSRLRRGAKVEILWL